MNGKHNVVADSLSRRPTICSLSEISENWKEHLVVEYSKNTFACQLMDDQVQHDRYKVVDDIIYDKGRIYLVPQSKVKKIILKEICDSPLVGHPGYLKTYKKILETKTMLLKTLQSGLKGRRSCLRTRAS